MLVNNAGTTWGAPYETFPESGFQKVFDLNVSAPFFLTRDLTQMLEQAATETDPARVINIGSMDGLHVPKLVRTGTFSYSASKAAVHHLTRTLAVELAPRHITVNAVAPGLIATDMTGDLDESTQETLAKKIPLGRLGVPEDVAGVVWFLASDEASYITGQVVGVNGGMYM